MSRSRLQDILLSVQNETNASLPFQTEICAICLFFISSTFCVDAEWPLEKSHLDFSRNTFRCTTDSKYTVKTPSGWRTDEDMFNSVYFRMPMVLHCAAVWTSLKTIIRELENILLHTSSVQFTLVSHASAFNPCSNDQKQNSLLAKRK